MKLSEKIKSALRETANLLALTLVAWASFLTWDPWLALAGLVMEAVFLVWAMKSRSYENRVESRRRQTHPKWIDLWLLIVTVSGLVIIAFFGFGKMLLTPRLVPLSHAQGWEAAAIWWTALFFAYYACKHQKTRHPARLQVFNFVLTVSFAGLIWLLWYSIHKPVLHVLGVLSLGLCLLVNDLVLVFEIDPAEDKKTNERSRSLASLWVADIPMLTTLFLLLLYLLIYYDADNRDVFVSGVIAFQLLFSNAVFVLTEFAWLQLPSFGEANSHESQTRQDNGIHADLAAATTGQQLLPDPAKTK